MGNLTVDLDETGSLYDIQLNLYKWYIENQSVPLSFAYKRNLLKC